MIIFITASLSSETHRYTRLQEMRASGVAKIEVTRPIVFNLLLGNYFAWYIATGLPELMLLTRQLLCPMNGIPSIRRQTSN